MRILLLFLNILTSFNFMSCRDFYMGMFNRDDYLVAQDNLYKEKRPYTRVQAEYGRLFKCPITYFRVVDRLGMGPGPVVKILKGGLQKNYISVRLRSGYNLPISVNIYVGCQNKEPRSPIRPTKPTKATQPTTEAEDAQDSITSESTTVAEVGTTDLGEDAEATTGANEIENSENKADSTTANAENNDVTDSPSPDPSRLLKKKKNGHTKHLNTNF